MLLAAKVEEDGFYLEDVLQDDRDSGFIPLPPQPCIKPRWDGVKWIEEDPEGLDRLAVSALTEARKHRMQEINCVATKRLAFIRDAYPQFEIDTWNDQRSEAAVYRADSNAETPMLSGIAAARGLPLDELAERVLSKVDHYRDAVSEVTGKRQWCEDQVFAAESIKAVNAVEWPE